MKEKPTVQSAFFNLRVLIGLFIVVAGGCLALAGLDAFSALTASMAQAQQKNKIITNSKDPLVPNGFDCSKIHELGIDKQMSFRAGAIMIACGQAQGGGSSARSPLGALTQFIRRLLSPAAYGYGGTDVDLITGTETYPFINQSDDVLLGQTRITPTRSLLPTTTHERERCLRRIGIDLWRPNLYPPHQGQRSKPLP